MELNLSTRTTSCAKFAGKTYPNSGPIIYSLSSTYSIAGATSVIAINGENFREYSMVKFGNIDLNPLFINSFLLTIYVPRDLEPGTYCVFVYNDNLYSNSIDYTLDESSGFWELLENQDIKPTNSGNVRMIDKIVLGKYFIGSNIPAAYLHYQGQSFPIHNSILDTANFYNTNPLSKEISVTIGSLNKDDLSTISLEDDVKFHVNPGTKLIVYSKGKGTNNTLYEVANVTNNSSNPISVSPLLDGLIDKKIHRIIIHKL